MVEGELAFNLHYSMLDKLSKIKESALAEIKTTKNAEALQNFEIKYLGRKSKLNEILRSLSTLSDEEKRQIGPEANALKKELEEMIETKRKTLAKTAVDFDFSLPGLLPKISHKHPLTQFLEKVEDVFVSMGFEVVDGPEIESDEYNFDLLNIPKEHPARDMWDTYYIKSEIRPEMNSGSPLRSENPKSETTPTYSPYSPTSWGIGGDKGGQKSKLLLRTHTSPVQLRAMKTRKPPVRIIVPGRVFRHEATDAGHEKNFYQCEGFVIDKGVSLANLVSTLKIFVKRVFGEKVEARVRPSYFPFVEPGIEVDMNCLICNGKGCSACKQSGWVEILGAGMIHPKVLENMSKLGKAKWNPKDYSGFAFGLGIDRFAMLYYGINDIRLFYSGDLRFNCQF